MIDTVPHPSLSSEMNNIVIVLISKEFYYAFFILEVHPDETVGVMSFALNQLTLIDLAQTYTCFIKASVLEVHIIIVVDIVKPHDLLTLLQE